MTAPHYVADADPSARVRQRAQRARDALRRSRDAHQRAAAFFAARGPHPHAQAELATAQRQRDRLAEADHRLAQDDD
jgi:hypothetical protein